MDDHILEEEIKNLLDYFDNYKINDKENFLCQKCAKTSIEIREEGNRIYIDKNHNEHTHRQTLLLYSKSIALAPNNSEELALAYSNRSALLLHLNKYKECLIDIERAYQITSSNNLKTKLLDRKTKCLLLLEKCNRSEKHFQSNDDSLNQNESNSTKLKLEKFIPAKQIPNPDESVSLVYNEKYGRHIIAAKDIKPGEIIMIEKGYVVLPKPDKKYLICTHCLDFAWIGIPCNYCALVMYCSEKCKEEAWQQYHDVECPLLPFFNFIKTDINIQDNELDCLIITVRLFIKAIKLEGLENVINDINYLDNNSDMYLQGFFYKGSFQDDKFRSLYNLLSMSENNNRRNNIFGTVITSLLYSKTNLFQSKINFNDLTKINEAKLLIIKKGLVKLKGIVDMNAWQYEDSVYEGINSSNNRGIMIAPRCSLINHSCYPNLRKILMKGSEILFFAVRPIAKGEQIYDSYGPIVMEAKSTRQTFLKNNFFFTCDCIPCTENWPSDFNLSLLVDNTSNVRTIYNITGDFINYLKNKMHNHDNFSIKCWPRDEETTKYAIMIIEQIYKYYNGYEAFLHAVSYMSYVNMSFNEMFGVEDGAMPKTC